MTRASASKFGRSGALGFLDKRIDGFLEGI